MTPPPLAAPGFANDEAALTAQEMRPSVDLADNLERFRGKLSSYLKPDEVARIESAYVFGNTAHLGQFRSSGDPYISHPLAVADTLADWHLDPQALTAALLHDVMEDTDIPKQEIADKFGKVVAELVDGVSKIDRIENQSFEEAQAENFRKMLLAMARDVRVILIKLSDRLHNMRTLGAVPPQKRRRIARETLDIYAPIANRLGLNALYRELQELAFRHLQPMRFRVLEKAVKRARGNRRQVVDKITEALRKSLPEAGIDAEVMGREKHLYSIYRKMRQKHLSFSQVLDIYGFRVIVKDVPTCYLALGVLHGLYKPVPGKFKDYIAIPKTNGYQSLHSTLIGPYGTPVEVQIRSREMHHIAESGVASHWLYKDETALDELQKKTHKWLKSLIELQSASGDSSEFLENVKVDLFPDEVYVFTPLGKILVLPRGSTAVDFAYTVHTDIGNRCVACRINFEMMPLRTELRNGDRVEIITADLPNPNPTWLSYVKSGKARAQIRHYLKTQQMDESVALGARLLGQALHGFGIELDNLGSAVWERFLRGCGAKSKNEVLTDIGLGKRHTSIVARRLVADRQAEGGAPTEHKLHGSIVIDGDEGITMQLAKCCNPIPGDPIVGLIRKGQGLLVHTHDCRNVGKASHERDNWVDVDWAQGIERVFEVGIRVVTENRPGVLAKIAAEIAAGGSNIQNVGIDSDPGIYTALNFTLQVTNRAHLARIMRSLRRLSEVVRITRTKD
ncbi:MAG: bifunctional (p)ppGpp synthetase/guanosine-3',5'-bis(diphosphate) 3'-pyrophosphohydrolase [Sterolibacterium sp.]